MKYVLLILVWCKLLAWYDLLLDLREKLPNTIAIQNLSRHCYPIGSVPIDDNPEHDVLFYWNPIYIDELSPFSERNIGRLMYDQTQTGS